MLVPMFSRMLDDIDNIEEASERDSTEAKYSKKM